MTIPSEPARSDDVAQSRGEANALQEMWAASERRYHDRRRQELRESWREYHEAQAQRFERLAAALVEEHRAKAEALLQPSAEEG